MANQETRILSPENVPMFTTVAFILAIVSLAFGLFCYKTVRRSTIGLAVLQVGRAKMDDKKELTQNSRVDALEKRLAGIEARAQRMEQAAAAAAAAVAATPTAPAAK